jgi:hypothetical protein
MWGALVCANDWSVSEPAYERALANEAPRRGVDGAICGHIHHAVINAMSNLCHINLRRLGRKLHRRGRAFRWVVRNHPSGTCSPLPSRRSDLPVGLRPPRDVAVFAQAQFLRRGYAPLARRANLLGSRRLGVKPLAL